MVSFMHRRFADVVRSWSEIRRRLFYIPEVPYTLTPGNGVYEIGPAAAQFDTAGGAYVRPIFIQSAYVIIGTARRWPLNILTRPQWDVLQERNLTDPDGPMDLFYDFNHPKATFNVSPKPGNGQTMYVSQWNPLHVFVDGDEAANVEDFYPDAYIPALKYAMAIEMCPALRLQVTQELLGLFQSAIMIVENKNNEKLSGAFGPSRTLDAPRKGDGMPMQMPAQQPQPTQ